MQNPSRAVWCNNFALARAHSFARKGGATADDLMGVERALRAADRRSPERFNMLFQDGFGGLGELVEAHCRWPRYAFRLIFYVFRRCNEAGVLMVEHDDIARDLDIPASLVPSVVLDLSRPPPDGAGAFVRLMKGRSLRGLQFAESVYREKKVDPRQHRLRLKGGRRRGVEVAKRAPREKAAAAAAPA